MPGEAAQPDLDNIEEQPEPEQASAPPRRMKRLAIVAGLAVVLLAGAGYGAAWSLGMVGGGGETAAEPVPVFLDLPEMTVNLSSVGNRVEYLRLSAALEMADEDTKAAIEPVLPRVLDAFQVYLRQLRSTDLEGSAGVYRLKEELVRRVNMAVHPAEIDGVVFKELIVQ